MSDGLDVRARYEAALRSIGAVAEHPMRRAIFATFVEQEPADQQIWCFDQLVRGAIWGRTPDFDAMLACADWLIRQRRADNYDLFAGLFEVATKDNRDTIKFLLRDPPPHRTLGANAKLPQVRLPIDRDVTLGERKSFARGNNKQLLERLLMDPSPLVFSQLLGNPNITVAQVISAVARRPSVPELLDVVLDHPRWFSEAVVREAVVRNPFGRTGNALRLLPTLNIRVLREIGNSADLHPQVHAFAKMLVDLRERRTAPWKV